MPLSGLVLVCSDRELALRELRANPLFTIGDEQAGGRLPVVLDTDTHGEHRAQLAWVQKLAGVGMVELAYADYCEGGDPTEEIKTDGA